MGPLQMVVGRVWRSYQLPLVMGGILAASHVAWRRLQDQAQFVPPGLASKKLP